MKLDDLVRGNVEQEENVGEKNLQTGDLRTLSLMKDELFFLKEPLTVVGALRNHSRWLGQGRPMEQQPS